MWAYQRSETPAVSRKGDFDYFFFPLKFSRETNRLEKALTMAVQLRDREWERGVFWRFARNGKKCRVSDGRDAWRFSTFLYGQGQHILIYFSWVFCFVSVGPLFNLFPIRSIEHNLLAQKILPPSRTLW